MGHLTEDMTRLRDEIGTLKDRRVAFVGELQSDVAALRDDVESMQLRFSNNHSELARETKDGLAAFVAGLKTDVSQMTRGFRNDRFEMAKNTKMELEGFVTDIKDYVNALSDEVFDLQEGFQDAHAAMAHKLRDNLGAFASNLKTDVTRMLEGFFSARTETAQDMNTDLRAFTDGLEKYVSELAKKAEQMQAGFRHDHADMAQKVKDNLGSFVSNLKENVEHMISGFGRDRFDMAREGRIDREIFLSGLRQSLSESRKDIADLRAEFAADIEGARQAWVEASPIAAKLETKVKQPAAKPGKRKDTTPAKKDEAQIFPDDLTQISGIGPGRQSILNTAGIHTFAQLAKKTPVELMAALGKMGKAAGVEKWIEQAKEMV